MGGTDADEPELLEAGREPRRVARIQSWGGRLSPAWRRVAATAALVLVVAGFLGYRWLRDRPPTVPQVAVAADPLTSTVPLWSAGPDGRPVAPLTVSVSAALTAPQWRAGSPAVVPVGLTGPGLTTSGSFPALTLGRAPADIEFTAQASCDDVPIPGQRNAYAIRLHVTDGPRTTDAVTPLGASAAELVQRLTVGCSTWLAARDLTVTDVHAVVDPGQPHAELTLEVSNRGRRPALVWTGVQTAPGVTVSDVRAVLPAHSRSSLHVSVHMSSCWSWRQPVAPPTTAGTPLGLLAAVGIDRPLAQDALPSTQSDNGLVLGPAAATQLRTSLVQACGGIASPALLSSPGRDSYDPVSTVLTAHLLVDLPQGLVRETRFLPTRSPASSDLRPLFSSTPWLRPDSTGQAGYTVRYTVPADVSCFDAGPLVTLDVEARVRTPSGELDVRFELSVVIQLPDAQVHAACGRRHVS